jgi:hypothetical protein
MRNFQSKTAGSALAVLGLTITGLMATVTVAHAQQTPPMAEAAHKGTFNYLRTEPNRHSHILLKMRRRTRFEVVGSRGDYDAVILANGMRGWTYKTNVRFL